MAKILVENSAVSFKSRKQFGNQDSFTSVAWLEKADGTRICLANDSGGGIIKKYVCSFENNVISYSNITDSNFAFFDLPNNEVCVYLLSLGSKVLAFEELYGKVYYTDDANTWTQVNGVTLGNPVVQAAYYNGKIVVIVDNGTYLEVHYSTNNGASFSELNNSTDIYSFVPGTGDKTPDINLNKLFATTHGFFLNTGVVDGNNGKLPIRFAFTNNTLGQPTVTTLSNADTPEELRYVYIGDDVQTHARFSHIFECNGITCACLNGSLGNETPISKFYYLDSNLAWKPFDNVNDIYESEPEKHILTDCNFSSFTTTDVNGEIIGLCASSHNNAYKNSIFKINVEVEHNDLQQRDIYSLTLSDFNNNFKNSSNNDLQLALGEYVSYYYYGKYFLFLLNDSNSNNYKVFETLISYDLKVYLRTTTGAGNFYPSERNYTKNFTAETPVVLVNGTAGTGEFTLDTNGYTNPAVYSQDQRNNSYLINPVNNKYSFGGNIFEDQSIYIWYTPITYNITYYGIENAIYSGSGQPKNSYTIEDTFQLLNFNKYGYTFQGWYDNSSYSGVPVAAINQGSTENKAFYAKWVLNVYNIDYTLVGGLNNIDNANTYDITRLPMIIKPATKQYYNFTGWSCSNNNVSISEDSNDNYLLSIADSNVDLVGSIVLVANWSPIEYTITYDADGGSIFLSGEEITNQGYTIESNLKLPGEQGGAIITKPNYDLIKWIDAVSGEDISASILLSAPKNCSIKAIWNIHSYSISYNFDGGNILQGEEYQETYTINDTYIRMPKAIKNNHSLAYYTLAGDSVNQYTSITVAHMIDPESGLAKDLSFTAVYHSDFTVNYSFFVIDSNNNVEYLNEVAENIANDNVLAYDGNSIINLKEPYAAGYDFYRWHANSANGLVITTINSENFDNNIYNLFGEFKRKTYNINYFLNGGINSSSNKQTYSEAFNLENPTKSGYDFNGWFDNPSFEGTRYYHLTPALNGNISLYAKWLPTTYTISFDPNGGIMVDNSSMNYNCEEIQPLNNAACSGYYLEGWYIEGSNTIYQTTEGLLGNITLKAKWAEIKRAAGAVNVISYNTAQKLIYNELIETMEDNYAYYKDLNVIIANEQEFIKLHQQKPNAVYIVLKYSSASVNFGQSVLPVTMTVVAEQNKIDKVQNLLVDFVAKFNLVMSENNTIQQIYETPTVTSNFNKMFEGFRSVMYVSGYLVVSKTANFFTFSYAKDGCLEVINTELDTATTIKDEDVNITIDKDYLAYLSQTPATYILSVNSDGVNPAEYTVKRYKESGVQTEEFTTISLQELYHRYGIEVEVNDSDKNPTVYAFDYTIKLSYQKIEVITYVFSGNTQLDTQAFYNVKNFTESRAKTGTIVLSFTTYLLSSIDIVNDVLDVYLRKIDIDRDFKIYVNPTFGNPILETFKLQDCQIQGDVGKIPMITMVFTN